MLVENVDDQLDFYETFKLDFIETNLFYVICETKYDITFTLLLVVCHRLSILFNKKTIDW